MISKVISWRPWVAICLITLVGCGVDTATKSDIKELNARLDSIGAALDETLVHIDATSNAVLDSLQAEPPSPDLWGPLAGNTLWLVEPTSIDLDPSVQVDVWTAPSIVVWKFDAKPGSDYTWSRYIFDDSTDNLRNADSVLPGVKKVWTSTGHFTKSWCKNDVSCVYITVREYSRGYDVWAQAYTVDDSTSYEPVSHNVILLDGKVVIGSRAYASVPSFRFTRLLQQIAAQLLGS